MGKGSGSKELKAFLERMEKLKKDVPGIINELAVHEGEHVVGRIKEITPRRQKHGGTLIDNFHSHRDEGNFSSRKAVLSITNNVEYASFVEKGHRKRNGKGWVQGRFMMRMSVRLYRDNEMDSRISQFIGKKLKEYATT
jgi:hypothetical protein